MWTIEPITLDLKYTWKISRNASDQKTNLVVRYDDGKFSGSGEAAPNVRYNESAEEGIRQFDTVKGRLDLLNHADSVSEILEEADLFNSLSFAIESAWTHYQSARLNRSVYDLLGVERVSVTSISYTIPIMEIGAMKEFYESNRLKRFPYIKLKVNRDEAYDALKHLLSFCDQPVMVDANESFTDVEECIYWMEKIKRMPLVFLEQPMPAGMLDESQYMKKYSPFILMADESVTDEAEFSVLRKSFDGINMKLMKAGSYRNGIRLLREAKINNMKTMIGCMVETTLGISSALNLCSLADYADLDSFLLLAKEPFGILSESDGIIKRIKE